MKVLQLLMVKILNSQEKLNAEKLYNKLKNKMYALAFSILKDTYYADDAVSNTFVIIFDNMDKISKLKQRELEPYCLTILRHESYKIYNQNKNYVSVEDVENILWKNHDSSTEDRVLKILHKEEAAKLMSMLSREDRDLISLRYGRNWSFKDIGDYFEISDAAARKRHQRILEKLRIIVSRGEINE